MWKGTINMTVANVTHTHVKGVEQTSLEGGGQRKLHTNTVLQLVALGLVKHRSAGLRPFSTLLGWVYKGMWRGVTNKQVRLS